MKIRLPARLSWRLMAAILPPVILAVGAIVWLQYHLARREILTAINRETALLAQRLAADIDGQFEQRRRDLLTLAETPLIVDYYRNTDFGLLEEAGAYRRELQRYFQNFYARSRVYARIAYLDERGAPVADVNAAAGKPVPNSAVARARTLGPGGVSISEIYVRSDGLTVVDYAKPIVDERGRFKGTLLLTYDLARLREQLGGVVVGRRGVAYLRTAGGSRLQGSRRADDGLELLSAESPLSGRPWSVVVEAPLDDFLGPLKTVRDAALLTSLLGIAGLAIILLVLVRSITRPIAVLIEAARRFGGGDFSYRIAAGGSDELSTLSGAFNELGERLDNNKRLNAELQSQLIQAEKLSAVGQLISAVAHELNNPLGAISGYVQLAKLENDPAQLRRDLDHMYANVLRCRKVVDNLLFFVRQSRQERGRVDLNRAVDSALELLEYRLLKTDDVVVTRELASPPPLILGDFQQIVQILVNLINNACDAMNEVVRYPEGKRLILTTVSRGGRANIRVEDNGPGISAEATGRLFQPFFTTKDSGRGTGLGLSICAQIAGEHGGEIRVDNRPGEGCAFILDLPVGEEADFVRLANAEPPAPLPPVPGKRILIADDEKDIAEVIARLLAEDGDEVTVTHNGAEALRLLEERDFDLVISDMEMEAVKGPDIYKRLTVGGGKCAAKALFVTGDILNPRVLEFLGKVKAEHLAKPFDIDELRQTVRRMLAPTR